MVSYSSALIAPRSLRTTGFPFVLLEKSVKNRRLNTVCTDISEGAKRVVDHIGQMGYKNVLIATGTDSLSKDNLVIESIKNAIDKKGGIDKPDIVELSQIITSGEIDPAGIEKYLRPPHRAEIIIVIHSELVYKIMSMLRKKKLRVPQDIALISMEEGIAFDLMFSPVTCLSKSFTGMALKVAHMIWSEVKNSGKTKFKRQVNIIRELVVRNS